MLAYDKDLRAHAFDTFYVRMNDNQKIFNN